LRWREACANQQPKRHDQGDGKKEKDEGCVGMNTERQLPGGPGNSDEE
jgi:hypothetical protein